MAYRLTVVLEYPSERDAPGIGPDTHTFGHTKVHAVQFSDALAELEVLLENASEEVKDRAHRAAIGALSMDERTNRIAGKIMAIFIWGACYAIAFYSGYCVGMWRR